VNSVRDDKSGKGVGKRYRLCILVFPEEWTRCSHPHAPDSATASASPRVSRNQYHVDSRDDPVASHRYVPPLNARYATNRIDAILLVLFNVHTDQIVIYIIQKRKKNLDANYGASERHHPFTPETNNIQVPCIIQSIPHQ